MPRKIDYADRGDLIIDAVCRVILRGGVSALSLRAVAGEVGIGASSILHQFDNRARLLSVSAVTVCDQRMRSAIWACHQLGPVGLLPHGQVELDRARIWLAFTELASSEEAVAEVVARGRADQRAILARTTRLDVGAPELVALTALIEGLVTAMTATVDPLTLEQAARALALHLRHTGLALERTTPSATCCPPYRAPVVDERSTTLTGPA